jgi:hypothetical protein
MTTVNNELERIRKEAVVAQFEILSRLLRGESWNTSVTIASLRTEV